MLLFLLRMCVYCVMGATVVHVNEEHLKTFANDSDTHQHLFLLSNYGKVLS